MTLGALNGRIRHPHVYYFIVSENRFAAPYMVLPKNRCRILLQKKFLRILVIICRIAGTLLLCWSFHLWLRSDIKKDDTSLSDEPGSHITGAGLHSFFACVELAFQGSHYPVESSWPCGLWWNGEYASAGEVNRSKVCCTKQQGATPPMVTKSPVEVFSASRKGCMSRSRSLVCVACLMQWHLFVARPSTAMCPRG